MRIGSSSFIAVLWVTAIVAALTGYATESPSLTWSSAVVASYALHLMAVEHARRQSATSETEVESTRRLLEAEREEVARLKRAVDRQRAQAEEQWKLLREMVQERLQRSPDDGDPAGSAFERTAAARGGVQETKRSDDRSTDSRQNSAAGIGLDEPSRIYGRW